jgi:hypothetical protein
MSPGNTRLKFTGGIDEEKRWKGGNSLGWISCNPKASASLRIYVRAP